MCRHTVARNVNGFTWRQQISNVLSLIIFSFSMPVPCLEGHNTFFPCCNVTLTHCFLSGSLLICINLILLFNYFTCYYSVNILYLISSNKMKLHVPQNVCIVSFVYSLVSRKITILVLYADTLGVFIGHYFST